MKTAQTIFSILLAVALLVCSVQAARSAQEYQTLFKEWAEKYNKKYSENSEMSKRFEIFVKNFDAIEQHNADKTKTYTLECNMFCDTTWEEFKAMFGMENPTAPQHCSATASLTKKNPTKFVAKDADVPTEIDWRLKNVITPVKNQQRCGSCWTFSTTGCLEAHFALKTGILVSLSEQQLIDCAGDFDNHGCSGGLPSFANEYMRYSGGLQAEATYPYKAVDQKCQFDKQYIVVDNVLGSYNFTEGDENSIYQAVGSTGPVSIAYQVVQDFRFYKSGVYQSTVCKSDPMSVNHAVLAVGYGIDSDPATGAKLPYFIVKNSWSKFWGMGGYFNILRGKNMCGIATCASYPLLG